MNKYEKIAGLLDRRIGEMKENDTKVFGKEYPLTRYIGWALEECEENDGLVVELTDNSQRISYPDGEVDPMDALSDTGH